MWIHFDSATIGEVPVLPRFHRLWRLLRTHKAALSVPVERLGWSLLQCKRLPAGRRFRQILPLKRQNSGTSRLAIELVLSDISMGDVYFNNQIGGEENLRRSQRFALLRGAGFGCSKHCRVQPPFFRWG